METIFLEITLVICCAALLSILFRILKQPAILAYILTGIIVGPIGFFNLEHETVFRSMADIGIALLLFMLGLELRFSGFRSVGRTGLIVGASQIFITSITGFILSTFLNFSLLSSLFVATALTFSSTIIILKLLSDKKDQNSLYGKITIGLLLVQDFFAILILIFLSSFSNASVSAVGGTDIALLFVKGFVLFGIIFVLSEYVFPKLISFIARLPETLFLFSLAWVFGFVAFVASPLIGLHIAIGGFLAGIALAHSSENFQIIARVRSLRDFFITIFFVLLGMQMTFTNITLILLPALVLSFFVLFIKPLFVFLIMSLLGYRKRTSFLVGLNTAQISEFSLIIVFLGNSAGQVSDTLVSLITLVGVVSFAISSYFIMHGNRLFERVSPYLSRFEKKHTLDSIHTISDEDFAHLNRHVVLVGAHRIGKSVLDALIEEDEQVLVIDFDPDIIKLLRKSSILSIFGDVTELDIQEKSHLEKAKLIISTVPDIEDNLALLRNLRVKHPAMKIVVIAQTIKDAKTLYDAGANYVVLPHVIGGKHLAHLIKTDSLDTIDKLKLKDLKDLH